MVTTRHPPQKEQKSRRRWVGGGVVGVFSEESGLSDPPPDVMSSGKYPSRSEQVPDQVGVPSDGGRSKSTERLKDLQERT